MEDKYTKEDVIEFCEWCVNNYSDIGCGEWTDREYYIEEKTTTELFDLWVKSKQETK